VLRKLKDAEINIGMFIQTVIYAPTLTNLSILYRAHRTIDTSVANCDARYLSSHSPSRSWVECHAIVEASGC